MKFREARLKGAWIIEPVPIGDERGSFARVFCEREFAERGLVSRFVQHSVSHSRQRGTLRGMHFQEGAASETKLVSCPAGSILDVIVDLRPGSPTYLQWESFEISARNRLQLYIPQHFAHGFMALGDDVMVHYLISRFHEPSLARGMRYDDPELAIQWPSPPTIVSEKDMNWPMLKMRADSL
jgi:dTDP-4-dehydrorhamnose 3,5-epimerase